MNPDPKTVAESLDAYRRGEYQTTQEVLDELEQRRQWLDLAKKARQRRDANEPW